MYDLYMDQVRQARCVTVAGLLVCFGVWFLDYKAHIDDPVGAVAVHMMNGIWGTIAVGLFATDTAPDSTLKGLFYGGGFDLLGIQLVGFAAVAAWAAITMIIVMTPRTISILLRFFRFLMTVTSIWNP